MTDPREAEFRRTNRLLQIMQLARLEGRGRAESHKEKVMFQKLEELFDAFDAVSIDQCYIVERRIMLFRYQIVCGWIKWLHLGFWDWLTRKNAIFYITEMEWEDWTTKNSE